MDRSVPQYSAGARQMTERGEDATELLPQSMVAGGRLVLDTGSFYAPGALKAITQGLLPELVAQQRQALVMDSTVQQIEALQGARGNGQDHEQAARILAALDAAQAWLRVGDPYSERDNKSRGMDSNAGTLIRELLLTQQLEQRFCVVTQNEALARVLLQNAHSPAITGVMGVSVACIEDGRFQSWDARLRQRDGLVRAGLRLHTRIAGGYRVIVDTSSLMLTGVADETPDGVAFLRRDLLPQLQAKQSRLIVPLRVLKELRSQPGHPAVPAALCLLEKAVSAGDALVVGDELELASGNERFADPVLVRAVIRYQYSHDLCIITQDEKLARLLLRNRDPRSDRDCLVVFITAGGASLGYWESKLLAKAQRAAGAAE